MQEIIKLTVRLPAKLHEQLKKRARQSDQSLNKVVIDALEEGLEHPQEYPMSEHEKFRKVLRDSGMLVELGPEWFKGLEDVPLLTHEECWELTKGLPPLSETIIEERGPR
jgi:Arc-like DNA binding domain